MPHGSFAQSHSVMVNWDQNADANGDFESALHNSVAIFKTTVLF